MPGTGHQQRQRIQFDVTRAFLTVLDERLLETVEKITLIWRTDVWMGTNDVIP
jgi:hypothetical protein